MYITSLKVMHQCAAIRRTRCSDPRDVPRIVDLSRASYRKMIQNLWWAAGYNVFAIPLAAGVLASRGIVLSPAIGAVLMSVSTVIVAHQRTAVAACQAVASRHQIDDTTPRPNSSK
jgi:cation transport ATPase